MPEVPPVESDRELEELPTVPVTDTDTTSETDSTTETVTSTTSDIRELGDSKPLTDLTTGDPASGLLQTSMPILLVTIPFSQRPTHTGPLIALPSLLRTLPSKQRLIMSNLPELLSFKVNLTPERIDSVTSTTITFSRLRPHSTSNSTSLRKRERILPMPRTTLHLMPKMLMMICSRELMTTKQTELRLFSEKPIESLEPSRELSTIQSPSMRFFTP